MKRLKFLGHFVRGHYKTILLAGVLGAMTVASGVGLLTISTFLIAAASLHPPLYTLQLGITGVRFFGFTRGFFRYGERITSHNLSLTILSKMRVSIFKDFYSGVPLNLLGEGNIFKRVIEDVEFLEDFFVRSFYPLIVLGVAVFSAFIFLYFFSVYLSISAVILIIIGVLVLFASALIMGLSEKKGRLLEEIEILSNEIINTLFFVQTTEAKKKVKEKIDKVLTKFFSNEIRERMARSKIIFFYNVWIYGSSVIFFLIAWILKERGIISGKSMLVVVIGYIATYEAVFPVILAGLKLGGSINAAGRLLEIKRNREKRWREITFEPVEVRIKDLSFQYGTRSILKNISFNITPGSKVAVVGHTGSGKTTLLSIIAGILKPGKGYIYINGFPPGDIMDKERAKLCILEQNPYIFFDSLKNNLTFGDNIPEEDLFSAIDKVMLGDFLKKLPDGFETLVGPDGFKMSGGEARRLAMARLFVKKQCGLVLLDEPLEHIDFSTGKKILENTIRYFRGSTVVVATHHLSILPLFDHVIVLSNGEIAEYGPLSDLLHREGALSKLISFSAGFFAE